jgi:hypothetical protein
MVAPEDVLVEPVYRDPRVLARLRAFYRSTRPPMMVAPFALPERVRAALRVRLDEAAPAAWCVADRGRYRATEALDEPALLAALAALAEAVAEEPLTVESARWLVLGRGDYALTKDDAAAGARPERRLELWADLSAATTGEAELVYTDGRGMLAVPQLAGSVALVERTRGLYRWQRYLGHRVGEARVHRLLVTLRPAAPMPPMASDP